MVGVVVGEFVVVVVGSRKLERDSAGRVKVEFA